MDDQTPVYLILMGNSKQCKDKHIKRIFDLKGSMVKREVDGDMDAFKNTEVLKDKNFLKLKKKNSCLQFRDQDRSKIIEQLGLDITLLQQFNLMDYSLLFVIEYNPAYAEMHPHLYKREDGGFKYPLQPTKEHLEEMQSISIELNKQENKMKVSRAFLEAMAGPKSISNTQRVNILLNLRAERMRMDSMNFDDAAQEERIRNRSEHTIFESIQTVTLEKSNPEYWKQLFNGRASRHCYMSEDGKFLYHLGIIDYLQDFNIDKWGENKFKSLIWDGEMISSVPPHKYANRFFNFMQQQVVVNQEAVNITVKEKELRKIQKRYREQV